MVNEVLYFLPPLLGFMLIALGYAYKADVAGILGGFVLLTFGAAVLMEPLPLLSTLLNLLVGTVSFGFGGFLFVGISLEQIEAFR